MTTNVDFWKDLENGIVPHEEIPVQSKPLAGSDWDEQLYFNDPTITCTSSPIETLQQKRMSEEFEAGYQRKYRYSGVKRVIYLIGFFLSFGAAIVIGVQWMAGAYSFFEGALLIGATGAAVYFCMLRAAR